MDKFYVGQRVRIVRRNTPGFDMNEDAWGYGMTGTIIERGSVTNGYQRWRLDIFHNGQQASVIEPCLEPIYDGDQKVSWDECAWSPVKQSIS